MRKRFSERHGYKRIRDSLQLNNIDEALENRLWNTFKLFYLDSIELNGNQIRNSQDYNFFKNVYDEFFKIHEVPNNYVHHLTDNLWSKFFGLQWYEIYDFLEYIQNAFHNPKINHRFKIKLNQVLEDEMSGYRLIDEYIAPIIDEVEIQEVEEAMNCQYEGVKRHLANALEHLSDRTNPDFINSIKESISSVESIMA